VTDEIKQMKKERMQALESSVEDRELTVIKMSATSNTRSVNMFLQARDKAEQEKLSDQEESKGEAGEEM